MTRPGPDVDELDPRVRDALAELRLTGPGCPSDGVRARGRALRRRRTLTGAAALAVVAVCAGAVTVRVVRTDAVPRPAPAASSSAPTRAAGPLPAVGDCTSRRAAATTLDRPAAEDGTTQVVPAEAAGVQPGWAMLRSVPQDCEAGYVTAGQGLGPGGVVTRSFVLVGPVRWDGGWPGELHRGSELPAGRTAPAPVADVALPAGTGRIASLAAEDHVVAWHDGGATWVVQVRGLTRARAVEAARQASAVHGLGAVLESLHRSVRTDRSDRMPAGPRPGDRATVWTVEYPDPQIHGGWELQVTRAWWEQRPPQLAAVPGDVMTTVNGCDAVFSDARHRLTWCGWNGLVLTITGRLTRDQALARAEAVTKLAPDDPLVRRLLDAGSKIAVADIPPPQPWASR